MLSVGISSTFEFGFFLVENGERLVIEHPIIREVVVVRVVHKNPRFKKACPGMG